MGLWITGVEAKKDYSYSYRALHRVRWLAAKVAGFEGEFKDYSEKFMKPFEEPKKWQWEIWPQFWQLFHFSDCEGILVGELFLKEIDYSKSFSLGNSTRLLEELKTIKDRLSRDPSIVDDPTKEMFFSLYDVVEEECEEGSGIIRFH